MARLLYLVQRLFYFCFTGIVLQIRILLQNCKYFVSVCFETEGVHALSKQSRSSEVAYLAGTGPSTNEIQIEYK